MIEHRSLLWSGLLHIFIFFLVLIQIHLPSRKLEFPKPIPVMFVPIDKITQSPRRAKVAPKIAPLPKKALPQEIEKPKTSKIVPKVAVPTFSIAPSKDQPSKKSLPPPSLMARLNPFSTKKNKVDLQAKPEEKKVVEAPKEEPPKAALPKKKTYEDAFSSLLQEVDNSTLSKSEEAAAAKAIDTDNITDKLSISELDALRQQIQTCWYVQAKKWDDEDLVVEASVEIGPDANVKNVTILNAHTGRKKRFFQAAVDSVKQALLAPECRPLKLPPDKYDQWRKSTFIFNPKGMK